MHQCYIGLPQRRIRPCHNTGSGCFFGAICGAGGPITSLTHRSNRSRSILASPRFVRCHAGCKVLSFFGYAKDGFPERLLPHALNSLYRAAPKWLIETLFACVAATLKDFAASPRWMGVEGGQAAFSLVLHTWSQDLGQHLHLHAVMACGVLGVDGQWQLPVHRPDFLFPVRALSRVFRAKFMAALTQRAQDRDAPEDANLTAAGRKALYRHDWVVYAKAPLGGPPSVSTLVIHQPYQ